MNKQLFEYFGNIVPVPALYESDLTVNYQRHSVFIRKKLEIGDKIFYLAHSASEFKYMSESERLGVVQVVSNELKSTPDAILLAQPVGSGSMESQCEEGLKMIDRGADVLVILPTKPVMSGKFYSCHYDKVGFNETIHDDYYLEYLNYFSNRCASPIIFHDAPLRNNKGLPLSIVKSIMEIKHLEGIKIHSPDPCEMQRLYTNFSNSKFCFDGFGKTVQFWSLIWGATARHSCWSWFDSQSDQSFFYAVKDGKLDRATEIISREWGLVDQIRKTGFGGYKELMKLEGLADNNLTREPGLFVTADEARSLREAYNLYKIAIQSDHTS